MYSLESKEVIETTKRVRNGGTSCKSVGASTVVCQGALLDMYT